MELRNREPDERVNYAVEHPLKEFAWLLGGALVLIVLATALLGWFAGQVAAWLPYRYEHEFARSLSEQLAKPHTRPEALAVEQELNVLARRLAQHMALPDDMLLTVHYNEGKTVNAYATLGAHIVMYRGLLTQLPDENTLAMVMAHEIAHVKLRHPVRAMGRGVAAAVVLSVVGVGSGQGAAGHVLGSAGGMTLLTFSRGQEREADAEALQALHQLYGHVGGAQDLFGVLAQASREREQGRVGMLSTHPLSDERIASLSALAQRNGWPADGERQALTPALAALRAQPATR